MKDVKIKLEQIVQNIELYRKALDKDGDMTNSDNKKLDIIIKRVFEKVTLADAYFNDENIEKLIKDYKAIETKWVALNITQMKSLDSDAIKKIDNLKDLLKNIDTWIASYNNVDKKNQNSLSKHLKELSEMKTEGELTIKVVDGNQLNKTSQGEYAKVISANDSSKNNLEEEIEKLQAIPEEDRTAVQNEQIEELTTRMNTILEFENDLINLIDNNKVRMDRVETIQDMNGNAINGQALYDNNTGELVLQLDATGQASLGAHELLHLVQAKKGKLVFLKNGSPAGIFNDLEDEKDAYRIQFSISPSSVPGSPKKIGDITLDFVKNIKEGKIYGTLPEEQHDLNTTITKLNDHPQYTGVVKKEMLNGEIIHPKTKQKVKDWDYYKDWKFIDFAEHKLFDPKGVKTNAEVLGFIIIK